MFSERLKTLRHERGLTQKQVFESIGMSPLGYQRYEYGTREPAYRYIIALAQYFNISADYLLGLIDEPRPLYSDKPDEE